MDKNVILHLGVFVGILLALNFFFHLHISIIGSLVLTLGLNFALGLIQSKSSCPVLFPCWSCVSRQRSPLIGGALFAPKEKQR